MSSRSRRSALPGRMVVEQQLAAHRISAIEAHLVADRPVMLGGASSVSFQVEPVELRHRCVRAGSECAWSGRLRKPAERRHLCVQRLLPRMAERGMAESCANARPRRGPRRGASYADRARNLARLRAVGQPRAYGRPRDRPKTWVLCLSRRNAVRMDQAVAIALKRRPHFVFRLGIKPPRALLRFDA